MGCAEYEGGLKLFFRISNVADLDITKNKVVYLYEPSMKNGFSQT